MGDLGEGEREAGEWMAHSIYTSDPNFTPYFGKIKGEVTEQQACLRS